MTWNILVVLKLKNSSRLSSSDLMLFKPFNPSAMALAPSSKILLLEKKFYIFIFC